jgi:ESCRT-II complex subunit VPS36
MTVHLTTHRLILIPDPIPSAPSSSTSISRAQPVSGLQCHLRHTRQTEFYTGFMRSSAKITLTLGPAPSSSSTASVEVGPEEGSWTCGVCGFANSERGPDGLRKIKCGLCGVGYEMATTISRSATRSSTPVPPGRSSLSIEPSSPSPILPPEPPTPGSKAETACPACTFLNHPSLSNCEICSTALPKTMPAVGPAQGAVMSPARGVPLGEAATTDIARLSFRRGGEKEAYRRLKNVLSDKAWERAATTSRGDRAGSTINGNSSQRTGAGIGELYATRQGLLTVSR